VTTLARARVVAGLAVLERDGFVLQGHYTGGTEPEWVARRLLARMHSYSRGVADTACRRHRADFMRFLLRWQHAAPGPSSPGRPACAR